LRQRLVESTQGSAEEVLPNQEIPLSFAQRIISIIRELKVRCNVDQSMLVSYLVIGHYTLDGELQFPELCEPLSESFTVEELHLWNTGDHFEPIFGMPSNWRKCSAYRKFFENPTAGTTRQSTTTSGSKNPFAGLFSHDPKSPADYYSYLASPPKTPNLTTSTATQQVENIPLFSTTAEPTERTPLLPRDKTTKF